MFLQIRLCTVWESHFDVNDQGYVPQTLIGTRSVCSVSDRPVNPVDPVGPVRSVEPVVAVGATPSGGLTKLETLHHRLAQHPGR